MVAVSNSSDKTTYTVHAKRWARGWELHIEGVGVTQSRALNDAEAMVRDYISLDTGTTPDSFAVKIIPEVSTDVDRQTREARQAVAAAERTQREAAAVSRKAAARLKDLGLSGREIAVVLDVSPQRVSQLLKHLKENKIAVPVHGRVARAGTKARLSGKPRDRV
jgi:CRP-like cAMP-binding protein